MNEEGSLEFYRMEGRKIAVAQADGIDDVGVADLMLLGGKDDGVSQALAAAH